MHGGYSPIVSYLLVKMTLFDLEKLDLPLISSFFFKVFAHPPKKQEHQTTPAVSFRPYTKVSLKTHLVKLFLSVAMAKSQQASACTQREKRRSLIILS